MTNLDDKLVEIIDVEKILAEVSPLAEEVTEELRPAVPSAGPPVADSRGGRLVRGTRQIQRCLTAVGMDVVTKNMAEALDYLKELTADGSTIRDHLSLVISDVEMPEMDSYLW